MDESDAGVTAAECNLHRPREPPLSVVKDNELTLSLCVNRGCVILLASTA
jgi:hypothetical protein